MKEPIVEVKGVYFGYRHTVLEDINLNVYEKDFLVIIGPNGGGKTTLIKIILGLLKPSRGKVRVFGTIPEKGRVHIGYLSQFVDVDMNYPVSVLEVVLMSRLKGRLLKRYSAEDVRIAEKALKKVDLLKYRDRKINELSGGEKQRMFVARALVNEPRLLIMDEPTTSLDAHSNESFYNLLKKLNEKIAIILVSHDLSAISTYVTKVACLNKKLYYHDSKELEKEDLKKVYGCEIEMLAHGVPHRVLEEHD